METRDYKTHIDRKYLTFDLNKRLTNSRKGAAHGIFYPRHPLFLLREDVILPHLNKTANRMSPLSTIRARDGGYNEFLLQNLLVNSRAATTRP